MAIDVARMLLLDPDELALTDTADHAIGPLSEAKVSEVVLLGRRGPEHAAFTNPELRELGEMTGVDVQVDPAELEGVEEPEDPTKRRNVEILRSYAERGPGTNGRRISLKFRRSPVEILGDERVTGICASSATGSRTAAPSPPARRRSSAAGSCSARSATPAARSTTCPSIPRAG